MDKIVTITGGLYRGRRLHAPPQARPTSQRAREALMSRLVSLWGGSITGHVADVCAGSGALGLELLSRGACHATFVDTDVRYVQANIQHLGVASQTTLIKHDARKVFPKYPHNMPLDVLVTDPPYGQELLSVWLVALESWVVPEHTIVCIEQEAKHMCVEVVGWELLQQAVYGRAAWTIWQKL